MKKVEPPLEIERKFLVSYVPQECRTAKSSLFSQGYLAADDESEVRIRADGDKCTLTVKKGKGLVREEREIPLDLPRFKILWPATEALRIEKTRTLIKEGKLSYELDEYKGPLSGLRTVEVEFKSKAEADQFVSPIWFGPEITGIDQFSNRNLAALSAENARAVLGSLLDPPGPSYGAVPFIRINGETKVVIVSNKGKARWIFPKGRPEPGMSAEEVAGLEAFEEAGVQGEIFGDPFIYFYWSGFRCFRVSYFVMAVKTLHTEWPEHQIRSRSICSLDEAKDALKDRGFESILLQGYERFK